MMVIISLIIVAAAVSVGFISTPSALGFGDFKAQNVSSFYGIQKESPTLVIVGDAVNRGLVTDDAELSLTLYDDNHRIIGVFKTYDDDVPPLERVPFKFVVNGGAVSGGIDNIATYRVQTQ